MYTVLRVTSGTRNDAFRNATNEFNVLSKGMFEESRSGISIACSISKSKDWSIHVNNIVLFVEKYRDLIEKYQVPGISFRFDVAIGPEDFEEKLVDCYCLDCAIIDLLSRYKISIEFSIYG